MIPLLLLAALLVGLIGCEKNSDASAGIPHRSPSITGVITTVALPDVLVEENPAESSGSAKASVRVTAETRILRQDGTAAGTRSLQAGQRARVWFTGPVAESYPVQATAGVIVIDSAAGIVSVQERHEAQFMAVPGVVGVGIGERDGAEVIVVFVEEQTAEIVRNVPDTLDGYPVVVEQTGPVGAFGLPGSKWRLQEWSVSSLDPSRFTITADFSESQISGTSAINSYGGPYAATDEGRFSVGDLQSTLMGGSEDAMRAESLYLDLLRQARKHRIDGATMVLSDERGNQLLVFNRR